MSEDCDSTGGFEAPREAADPEPEPDQRLAIDIVVHAGDWPEQHGLEKLAAAVAHAVADELGRPEPHHEVALALSSDAAVQALNRDFRGLDKPTNVLSFPALPARAGPAATASDVFLGDIVLAAETLRHEADARAIPMADHFAHLLTHGILHLFGFDHQDDAAALEMEALETRVLRRLAIPDPYTTDQPEKEALGSAG